MAKGEGDLALPVGVDHVLGDGHFGVMTQHALDHRGDLRGRAGLQLGVDAGRLPFHVPVDHHAATTVAEVPLGHQVLVPGSELLGVGRHTVVRSPDMRLTDSKDRVGHLRRSPDGGAPYG